MVRILLLLYFKNAIAACYKILLVMLFFGSANAAAAVEHYVFISLSMPKPSIKQLLDQSKELNAQVVLRGFINNSHKTTAEIMQDLVTTSQYGLIVDPELFTKYQITKVPTFVIVRAVHYDKLSGNISWQEAIDIITRKGEVYAEQ